jgi:hypothetical protein
MRLVLVTGLSVIGVELVKACLWDYVKGLTVMVVSLPYILPEPTAISAIEPDGWERVEITP